jgi:DNA-binding beta-propeller fold protein YncE
MKHRVRLEQATILIGSAAASPPAEAATITLGSGFNHPSGVVADASGNVFVADIFNHVVKEILAAGGYTTVLSWQRRSCCHSLIEANRS